MGGAALHGDLACPNIGSSSIEYQQDSLILCRTRRIQFLKILYRYTAAVFVAVTFCKKLPLISR